MTKVNKVKQERKRKKIEVKHGGAKEQKSPAEKAVDPVKEETGSDTK